MRRPKPSIHNIAINIRQPVLNSSFINITSFDFKISYAVAVVNIERMEKRKKTVWGTHTVFFNSKNELI